MPIPAVGALSDAVQFIICISSRGIGHVDPVSTGDVLLNYVAVGVPLVSNSHQIHPVPAVRYLSEEPAFVILVGRDAAIGADLFGQPPRVVIAEFKAGLPETNAAHTVAGVVFVRGREAAGIGEGDDVSPRVMSVLNLGAVEITYRVRQTAGVELILRGPRGIDHAPEVSGPIILVVDLLHAVV